MATKTSTRVRDARLCTDQDGNEAIYIDGQKAFEADTIFQCEVARACGSGPVTLRHHKVSGVEGDYWPEDFASLTLED